MYGERSQWTGTRLVGTGHLGGDIGAMTASEMRMPQIEVGFQALRGSIDDAQNALDSLTQRLAPVLCPTGPETANATPNAPTPVRCQMADTLEESAARVRSMVRSLQTLVDRLEL